MTSTIHTEPRDDDRAENIRPTLKAFKKAHGITSDKVLAERLGDGWTEYRVQQKLSGKSNVNVHELEDFARVFGVRPGVLYMQPNEAIRVAQQHFGLVIDWGRDLRGRTSRWMGVLAGWAA